MPCIFCAKQLVRFDLRVHCAMPDNTWFSGRMDDAHAPVCKPTNGQIKMMFGQSPYPTRPPPDQALITAQGSKRPHPRLIHITGRGRNSSAPKRAPAIIPTTYATYTPHQGGRTAHAPRQATGGSTKAGKHNK
mmetsp:Transcript_21175/g.36063  ORF Transcript_21175/g.36063 Transcript_21175/m.36063 type:complete len:133 (+) Transcript_21175:434-832(+)